MRAYRQGATIAESIHNTGRPPDSPRCRLKENIFRRENFKFFSRSCHGRVDQFRRQNRGDFFRKNENDSVELAALAFMDRKGKAEFVIGHTFGLAHSISGGNGSNVSVFNANLPVMYPFLVTGGPVNLSPDDQAGILSVYGP